MGISLLGLAAACLLTALPASVRIFDRFADQAGKTHFANIQANISPQIFLLMHSVNNGLFEMIINDAWIQDKCDLAGGAG